MLFVRVYSVFMADSSD